MTAWNLTKAFMVLQYKAAIASMSRSLSLDITDPKERDRVWWRWDEAEERYGRAMHRLRTRLDAIAVVQESPQEPRLCPSDNTVCPTPEASCFKCGN